MAFDFPSSPAVGDTFEEGGIKYTWSGTAWDLFTAGTANDFVLKAGDVMTGPLGFGADTHTIHGDTHLKHNVPAGSKHYFYCNARETVRIEGDATGAASLVAQGHIYTQGSGRFIFNNTDNNAWQNAISFNGGFHIQYKQGGNNDGCLRFFTANGGYTDAYVFETTISNSGPGIVVNGNVSAASLTARTAHIQASAYDGQGIAFYSGAYIFKAVGTGMIMRKHSGGTQWQIQNNDGTGNVNIATASLTTFADMGIALPELKTDAELKPFARKDEGIEGFDVAKVLTLMLAKIRSLETEVATLKKRR